MVATTAIMYQRQKDGKDMIPAWGTAGQVAVRKAGTRGCEVSGMRATIPTWGWRGGLGKAILGLEG